MHSPWDAEQFREAIHRVMQQASLSRQDIADLAGVDRSQVSRWLSGAHRPRFDALQQFAAGVNHSHPHLRDAVDEMLAAAGYGTGHDGTGVLADIQRAREILGPEVATAAQAAVEAAGGDAVLAFLQSLEKLDPGTREFLQDMMRRLVLAAEAERQRERNGNPVP